LLLRSILISLFVKVGEMLTEIARKADVLGALLFFILSVYFYKKENKTAFEQLLTVSVMTALIVDVTFIFDYYFVGNK
jgi:ABC-type cobalamin transport system permease subunit